MASPRTMRPIIASISIHLHRVFPKHQRHHTQYYTAEHEDIIDVAPNIGAIVLLYDFINMLARHQYLR